MKRQVRFTFVAFDSGAAVLSSWAGSWVTMDPDTAELLSRF